MLLLALVVTGKEIASEQKLGCDLACWSCLGVFQVEMLTAVEIPYQGSISAHGRCVVNKYQI